MKSYVNAISLTRLQETDLAHLEMWWTLEVERTFYSTKEDTMTLSRIRLFITAIFLFAGVLFLGHYADRIGSSIGTIEDATQSIGQ